jgi:hypothetical protein
MASTTPIPGTVSFPFIPNNGNPYAAVPVQIQNPDDSWTTFQCEFDSGDDIITLPASAAKLLGLNLTSGKPEQMQGVDDVLFTTYLFNLDLQLPGLPAILTQVPVVFDPNTDCMLLGRQGFWNKFKSIILDQIGQQITFVLA